MATPRITRRQARIEALKDAGALIQIQLTNGSESDLVEGVEYEFPDERDQEKVLAALQRIADDLRAQAARLEANTARRQTKRK